MSVLFISYSHKDEKLKNQLIQQLKVLEPEGLIEIWIDDQISAGVAWEAAINDALLQADMAILLITSNFLTSNFILKKEIPALLKRRQAGGVLLYPIIGKPCAWQEVTWLAELNVWPKNGEPIWGKDNKTAERYLAELTREIANMIKKPGGTELNTNLAIKSMEEKFHLSFSSPNPPTHEEISNMINDAISHGAPAYNNRNIRGCFEIYHYTARRLLTQILVKGEDLGLSGRRISGMEYDMMPTEFFKGMGMPLTNRMQKKESDPMLFQAINFDLRRTLEKTEDANGLDVDIAAWDLRFCFDRILLMLSAYTTIAAIIRMMTNTSLKGSGAPNKSDLRKAVLQSIHAGKKIYATGMPKSAPDERSIITASTFLLEVSKLLGNQTKNYFNSHPEKYLFSILDQINAENNNITPLNAYSIAWNILQLFDWYLMPSD